MYDRRSVQEFVTQDNSEFQMWRFAAFTALGAIAFIALLSLA